MATSRKTILITGAEGLVGAVLRRQLRTRYRIIPLTLTEQPFRSRIVDVCDLPALTAALRGADAVIHLAAVAKLHAPWEDILQANIVGTRNLFEAARVAGVPAVIFASSGHVLGFEEEIAGNELYQLNDQRSFDARIHARPDSLYAVSKVFGETIGRYYADVHGLRVICVRLGAVFADDDPASDSAGQGRSAQLRPAERYPRIRAKWLSHRDCANLFACAIEATAVRWAVVFGTSNNPRQIWSLDSARSLLGYHPHDSAPVLPTKAVGKRLRRSS